MRKIDKKIEEYQKKLREANPDTYQETEECTFTEYQNWLSGVIFGLKTAKNI